MEKLIDIHFNGQLNLYMSNLIRKENYDIYCSDIIDDEYFNLAYLKNDKTSLKEIYEDVKISMEKINRKPILYITSNIVNSKLETEIEKIDLQTLYTDVWMTLNNLEEFGTYKSKIDFFVTRVGEDLKDKFIQAVLDGFSGDDPEDPYESLSDGYRIALEKSFKNNNNDDYKVIHYLGLKKEDAVSTATVIYKDDKAIIYNVTTNKKYQKQGACKQMMSDIIKDLTSIGIHEVCVQTEKGFYTEQVYNKMGFKEKMLGKAYMEKQ